MNTVAKLFKRASLRVGLFVSLTAIIDVLAEGGIVIVEKKIPPAGGIPSISYSLG
jgi:hypothetical protein